MNHNKNFIKYLGMTNQDLEKEFGVALNMGLNKSQVLERQKEYGFNEIKSKSVGWFDVLLRQLKSPFIYLLLSVAFIALLMQSHFDALVIFCVVIINTLFGFFQEYRAERTLDSLKNTIESRIKVIRDGNMIDVPNRDLVPGDLVVLYPGDIIPADVRFIKDQSIVVDEALLTGESIAVKKDSAPIKSQGDEFFNATNIGFWGTIVSGGKGVAIVFATGQRTALGDISTLVTQTARLSSFEKGISVFSNFILRLMLISLIVIIVANLIIKGSSIDPVQLILFSIALAVSVIPEGLPIVTTFALSQGAMRLAKQKAVVKRLSAIEDLGNIEILCMDKTGTITENISTVEEIYGDMPRDTVMYATLILTMPGKRTTLLRGFDQGLFNNLSEDEKKQAQQYEKIGEIPFDSVRLRNVVLVKKGTVQEVIVRGAPETVVLQCANLNEQKKQDITQWVCAQGLLGRRVLAIGKKTVPAAEQGKNLSDLESHVQFMGMVAFGDPIKKTAHAAINKARVLGVEIKVLSGDAPQVCGSVAHQVGLISDPNQVITGKQFQEMDEFTKIETVQLNSVFARVSPQQKYEIIALLQTNKDVAYIGDGINDAPALKIANVGLAVQDAAGIARESADIILLKQSLMVIVDGIEEGRRVFANTLKYIRTTLSVTFGNFYSLSIASLLIPHLPMLPVQLLLLNIMGDIPMLALATDTIGEDELKRPAKYDVRGVIVLATVLGLISTLFDFIFFAMFYHLSPAQLQTSWFVESILTALVFLFSIRTVKVFFKATMPSIPLLVSSLGVSLAGILLPFTSFGQNALSFVPISMHRFGLIICVVIGYFIITDLVKLTYFYFYNPNPKAKN
jgi:Mg2+-importing ATPase